MCKAVDGYMTEVLPKFIMSTRILRKQMSSSKIQAELLTPTQNTRFIMLSHKWCLCACVTHTHSHLCLSLTQWWCWIVSIPKREFRITFYFNLSCHARIGLNTHTHTCCEYGSLNYEKVQPFLKVNNTHAHRFDFSAFYRICCGGVCDIFPTEHFMAFAFLLRSSPALTNSVSVTPETCSMQMATMLRKWNVIRSLNACSSINSLFFFKLPTAHRQRAWKRQKKR